MLVAGLAHAGGYSLDIEMARSGFSLAPPGLDAPEVQRKGHVHAGILVQYEMNPLVLVIDGEEVGAVVANRFDTQLGASFDVSKKLALRASLPMAYSWGSEIEALAGDGFGTGDLAAGVRYEILNNKMVAVGAHGDLLVPISSAGQYLGEASPRFVPGVSVAVKPGDLRIAADVGFVIRGPVTTQQTLGAGQELSAGLDVSYGLLKDKLRPHAIVLTRVGLEADYTSDASFPLEILAGAQAKITKEWGAELYGGRGITAGYGATDLRVMASVTYNKMPAEEKVVDDTPAPVFESTVTDAELDKLVEAPEPEPPPEPEKPKELAVVTQKEIIIRDPIQFEVGTDKILAESQPTLDFVAKLMSENADILSLIIEGHASGEGSFEYNYALSAKRAESVFRELVESGVAPTRLAYRAYGEVRPVKIGDDAANRRVVFSIARRLTPGEFNPGWDTEIQLPWNGETRTIPGPPPPAPVEPVKPAKEKGLDIDKEEN